MAHKILYIEDEGDFRESVTEILQDAGYDTLEASNGREGLETIMQHSPDLVLCDVNMPEMSGFDVLDSLHAASPEKSNIPFIFVTAKNQKQDKLKGLELCASDYIVKPVDFDVLLAVIKTHLHRRHSMWEEAKKNMESFKKIDQTGHEYLSPMALESMRYILDVYDSIREICHNNVTVELSSGTLCVRNMTTGSPFYVALPVRLEIKEEANEQ